MPNFHDYRSKPSRLTPYLRLWHWHDEHPLPERPNKALREALFVARRLRQAATSPRPVAGRDEFGEPVVSRYGYPTPARAFEAVPLTVLADRFAQLHAVNEHLYNGDGSWDSGPFSAHCGSGIPAEEIADRVVGYLAAHEAFGEPAYAARAAEGVDHLLRRRIHADGHVRMEGHHVVELVYGYVGCALLAFWHHDPSRSDCLDAACRLADRLVEEHIGGAIDHALKPLQVLGPLYRITGTPSYLRATLRRARRALALQLPYGGWPGADSRIWYHGIIARGLIEAYVSTPNTLTYYAEKDRLARAITAALNRVVLAQDPGGYVRVGRGGALDPVEAELEAHLSRHAARFTGGGFVPYSMPPGEFVARDVVDFLTAAFEDLGIYPAAIAAHGQAALAVRTEATQRPEFETYTLGRYAQFVARLARRSVETRTRTGALAAGEVPAAPRAAFAPGAAPHPALDGPQPSARRAVAHRRT